MGSVLRLSWWRFRITFGRRWSGYLAVVLLVGLVGGLSMGAVAGARRTQSSFPVYLASTNPSDVQFFTEFAPSTNIGYSARVDRAIARVPYVRRSVVVVGFDGTLQVLRSLPKDAVPGEAPPAFEGSLNGEYGAVDRVTLLRGRLADPRREDEFVISAGGAQEYGLHIGSTLPLGFYTDQQASSPTFAGYPTDKPHFSVDMKLVGIVEASQQVVQDDDAALGDQLAVITPALTRRLATCCAFYTYAALQIDDAARHEAAVGAAVDKIVPSTSLGGSAGGQTDAAMVAEAERVIRPESIAFGVFGLVAALAALLICGQVIARLVRRNAEDGEVLRALGAGPLMTASDGLIGILVALAAGVVLAMAVAVGLSPLAPIGAVRPVYPDPGVAFDWTVLGCGAALLVVVLGATAVVMAYRVSPHRAASARRGRVAPESRLARAATASGLSPAASTGIRSALGAGAGRDAAPVRSAVLGAVLAVVVVVASFTFGASLNSLVSQPKLYGWNWNYALLAGFSAAEDLPAAQTTALLQEDPDVGHWSGVYFENVELDGQSIPVLAERPDAAVEPTLLSGHGLESDRQVVLGPATLAALHTHIGDTVVADTGGKSRVRLRIVGTATLPTIGSSGDPELQMGTGAVLATSLFPAAALNQQGSPIPGPNAVFITVRRGVSPVVALRSLNRIDGDLSHPSGGEAPASGVVSVLRPAEIADYRAVGSTPSILAGILAAGAMGGLALTLVASVRRRRREFALLKALGFTQRQLAATVAWQSSVSAAVGVIFGVPLGIALGRWLWTLFARGISAVPEPSVPVLTVVLVALGALTFANLVATFPGRIAARTPTALLLRAE
ncbi:MAG: FtsX-like permease family protein [Acidimicrobiales bacterium]